MDDPEKKTRLVAAVRAALRQVIGTYGIALVHADIPDFMVGARRGSPLVLGVGKDENFLASDVSAIVAYTRDAVYLNDFDVVAVERDKFEISSLAGEAASIQSAKSNLPPKTSRKAITRITCSRKSLSNPIRARCDARPAQPGRMHRETGRPEYDAGAAARCRPRRPYRMRHRAACRDGRRIFDRATRPHSQPKSNTRASFAIATRR